MRIATSVLSDNVRANLASNVVALDRLERQISSGKRLTAPSDDPAAAYKVLRYHNDIALNDQYTRNADNASSFLAGTDTALGGLTDALQRARELAVQAGTGTVNAADMQAIGQEMNQLLLHAVQLGNSKLGGQYLFAGTQTTTAPFTAAGATPAAVTYNGDTNPILQDVAPGVQVQVNTPGSQVFTAGMNALIQIRNNLTAGNGQTAAQSGIPALDGALDGVLQVRGAVGAKVNSLDAVKAQNADESINLQSQRSSLEDVDIASAIVQLNASRNTYEAALGAAAKVITPSLAEFLH